MWLSEATVVSAPIVVVRNQKVGIVKAMQNTALPMVEKIELQEILS